MDRLTISGNFGNAFLKSNDVKSEIEAIKRLAAYEDSGLTPEEVMEFAKIVRCCDCEMYLGDHCSMTGMFGQKFKPNDFCSHGRKRK